MSVREELETILRNIYDNDEYVDNIIGEALTEENWQTMVDFAEKAQDEGKTVTYEDMVGLSLILRERLDESGNHHEA